MARILIVDDQKFIRTILSSMVRKMGHEAYVSPNGEHALGTLQRIAGIDLIITDMVMPEMDGHQLIDTIRSQRDLADLAIIIMSGRTTMAEVDRYLKAGALAFLSKPINEQVLAGYINSIDKKKSSADSKKLSLKAI